MFCDWGKPESKRYLRAMAISMSLYLLVVLGSVHWLKHHSSVPWKYIVAVLPVLPALYVPIAVVRFFRDIDELQRKIQLEAIAFAFTLSAVLTLSYGFLQNAGLPDLNWVWVWPVMGVSWMLGLVISRRRYR